MNSIHEGPLFIAFFGKFIYDTAISEGLVRFAVAS